jgi:hypothetical protein
MDPMRFLETPDEFEAALMLAIAEEYMHELIVINENLAKMISNAVWAAVK